MPCSVKGSQGDYDMNISKTCSGVRGFNSSPQVDNATAKLREFRAALAQKNSCTGSAKSSNQIAGSGDAPVSCRSTQPSTAGGSGCPAQPTSPFIAQSSGAFTRPPDFACYSLLSGF